MNIFVLDRNPVKAARMLCDKHVSKMILETAQMLSTVAVSLHSNDPFLYKPVHAKHPCTIWVGESYYNWRWLCRHGLAMHDEFIYRYGRKHKSAEVIQHVSKNKLGPRKKKAFTFWNWETPFAQAMPDEYKHDDPVIAYRTYYLNDKKRFAKWTKRAPPYWWKE
jgi:hypothetical protein